MFNCRSLSCLLVLAVVLTLAPRGSTAPADSLEGGSPDQLFQAYSAFFFLRRDVDFALEMTLRESFLAWLYVGINAEVDARSGDDLNGTLRAISPPELQGLDEESYAFADSLLEAPLRIRFLAWEDYQRTEFNHKFLQARLIKDRLIRGATPEQRKRMFNRDLESTFLTYRDEDFRDAILRFDELIDSYGYTDVSDLAFFRGESYLGIQIYDQAQADFQFVADHSAEPWYRLRALERLIALAGDHGSVSRVKQLWSQYDFEAGGQKGDDYWRIAEMTAKYLIVGSEWKAARDILDAIPNDSADPASAALRAADCSLALLELDDAEARYNALLSPAKEEKGASGPEVLAEARLKTGYIDYLRGDFDTAFQKLGSVKGAGDVAERAEIGCIWALFRLSAYPQVISRCQKFINDHSQSQYLYEARCLIGFSSEMMGSADPALDNYRVVMLALDDRQEFHDFNYELAAISDALGRLQELEAAIFVGGEIDLFSEYLNVRRQLQRLMDGLRFVRSLKTTPFLKDVLKEQKELYALFQEQNELEQKLYAAQDSKLLDQYQQTLSSLMNVGSELATGIRYYMKQKSLLQREEDKLYEMQMSDTLRAQLEQEWGATREALALVRQYRESADQSADPHTLVDLTGVEIELAGVQDHILKVRADLRRFGQEAVVSNLDLWSDFAYSRYTYGGLNFDFLYSREDRIGQLDEYIQQVRQLLQQREEARRDTVKLALELVPASNAGEPPYYPPPVPLWRLSVATASPTETPVEMPAAEPIPPAEGLAPETAPPAEPVASPTEEQAPADTLKRSGETPQKPPVTP